MSFVHRATSVRVLSIRREAAWHVSRVFHQSTITLVRRPYRHRHLSLSLLASQPAVTFPPARPHAHGSCRTNKRSRSCKRSRRIGAKPPLLTDFRDRNSDLKSADRRPVPRCKKFVSGCVDNVSEMTYFVSSGT